MWWAGSLSRPFGHSCLEWTKSTTESTSMWKPGLWWIFEFFSSLHMSEAQKYDHEPFCPFLLLKICLPLGNIRRFTDPLLKESILYPKQIPKPPRFEDTILLLASGWTNINIFRGPWLKWPSQFYFVEYLITYGLDNFPNQNIGVAWGPWSFKSRDLSQSKYPVLH